MSKRRGDESAQLVMSKTRVGSSRRAAFGRPCPTRRRRRSERAGGRGLCAAEVAGGRADEALLLAGVDTGGRSPVAVARAGADFGDHQDIPVTGDDIQLTQAAEVVALEDFETFGSEEVGGDVFGRRADELLLRPAPCWRSRCAVSISVIAASMPSIPQLLPRRRHLRRRGCCLCRGLQQFDLAVVYQRPIQVAVHAPVGIES